MRFANKKKVQSGSVISIVVLCFLLITAWINRPEYRVKRGFANLFKELSFVEGKDQLEFSVNVSGPEFFCRKTLGLDGMAAIDKSNGILALDVQASVMNMDIMKAEAYMDGEKAYIRLPEFTENLIAFSLEKAGEEYNHSVLPEYTGIEIDPKLSLNPFEPLMIDMDSYRNPEIIQKLSKKEIITRSGKQLSCQGYLISLPSANKAAYESENREWEVYLTPSNKIAELACKGDIETKLTGTLYGLHIVLTGERQSISEIRIQTADGKLDTEIEIEVKPQETNIVIGKYQMKLTENEDMRITGKMNLTSSSREITIPKVRQWSLDELHNTDLFEKITHWEKKYRNLMST